MCLCGNLWVCVVNAYVNRSTCAARRNRFNRVVSAVQNILISISNSVAYYISLSLFNNLVMQRCTLTHRYMQSVLLALAIRVGQRILLYSHSQVVKFFSLYNIYIYKYIAILGILLYSLYSCLSVRSLALGDF